MPDLTSPILLWKGQPHHLTLIPIPAGEFLMGSRGYDTTEEPRHRVIISRPFWLGATPVTQAQFAQWTQSAAYKAWLKKHQGKLDSSDNGPHKNNFPDKPDHPAEQISWHEAVGFAAWLASQFPDLPPGYRYCLPTEAQWEYACRAHATTEYHTGDGEASLRLAGWFDEDFGTGSTHAVGQLAKNDFDVYDMHGNVWEWCQDAWDKNVYAKRPDAVQDPSVVEASDPLRVNRGGSWIDSARFCRSAYRNRNTTGNRNRNLGFRLCVSPGTTSEPGTRNKDERSRKVEAERAGSAPWWKPQHQIKNPKSTIKNHQSMPINAPHRLEELTNDDLGFLIFEVRATMAEDKTKGKSCPPADSCPPAGAATRAGGQALPFSLSAHA